MSDALSSWLKTAATSTVQVSWARVAPPWGVRVDPKEDLALHMVLEGSCWIVRPDAQPLQLLQGDLVIANGLEHNLVHAPGGHSVSAQEFRKRPPPLTNVGTTAVVCASYRSDVHITRQMLRVLPPVMYLPASQARSIPHLSTVIDLAMAEIIEPGPGSELLITYLFDALFLYLLRAWLKISKLEVGWLAALQDRCVSQTLSRMHADPARQWTVDDLAAEAGISRATFSRHFTKRMGEAPISYLTRWRMSLAMQMLAETRTPLATLARSVGYESEFAFSRAFKRYYGAAPSLFRQRNTRTPSTVPFLLPNQLV